MRDPALLFAPWVAHWFPGAGGPTEMIELRWSTYVDMWDFAKGTNAG